MQLSEYEEMYAERVQKFMVEHPDFQQVINRDDVPLDAHLQLELKAHHDGPAIAYWLGKHPEIAHRVVNMNSALALNHILHEMRKSK